MLKHDLIEKDFYDRKSLLSFEYLLEIGYEVNFKYENTVIYVANHTKNGNKVFEINIPDDNCFYEFESPKSLIETCIINGKQLAEIWDDLEIY